MNFTVEYPDNYYLDLKASAQEPLTFSVVNENGERIFTETGTVIDKENVRLKLAKGQYSFSMSATSMFELNCTLR